MAHNFGCKGSPVNSSCFKISRMPPTNMDALPEELQLYIFEFLESRPPSELKSRQEPNLTLTASPQHPLKDISRVSKRWRRIVLPLLFKHACLRISIPALARLPACSVCGDHTPECPWLDEQTALGCKPYHVRMIQAIDKRLSSKMTTRRYSGDVSPDPDGEEGPHELSTKARATRFYHIQQRFLKFTQDAHLTTCIHSIVLLSERMLPARLGRYPHQSASCEWLYPATAVFWHHLLSIISPERVLILAPPTELACLSNAAIDTKGVSHTSSSAFERQTSANFAPKSRTGHSATWSSTFWNLEWRAICHIDWRSQQIPTS